MQTDISTERMILPVGFFAQHALSVARQLLGKFIVLCRDGRADEEAFQIHETEAYIGAHDGACHGRFGVTPRTAVLFGPPGHWYVHFTYGMHWMMNVVTDRDGAASGVLIRGAGIYRGPGRLTKALGIDKRFNALPIAPASRLWIEDRGHTVRRGHVRRTPRIGVDYAGDWKHKPYRFLLDQRFRDPLDKGLAKKTYHTRRISSARQSFSRQTKIDLNVLVSFCLPRGAACLGRCEILGSFGSSPLGLRLSDATSRRWTTVRPSR